jgi:hypothetical protein
MSEQDAATAVEQEQEYAPPPRYQPPPPPPPQHHGYGHEGAPAGAPPERVGHGIPRGFIPNEQRGPRPLDLITRTDEMFLRVKRVKVSNARSGAAVSTRSPASMVASSAWRA